MTPEEREAWAQEELPKVHLSFQEIIHRLRLAYDNEDVVRASFRVDGAYGWDKSKGIQVINIYRNDVKKRYFGDQKLTADEIAGLQRDHIIPAGSEPTDRVKRMVARAIAGIDILANVRTPKKE